MFLTNAPSPLIIALPANASANCFPTVCNDFVKLPAILSLNLVAFAVSPAAALLASLNLELRALRATLVFPKAASYYP